MKKIFSLIVATAIITSLFTVPVIAEDSSLFKGYSADTSAETNAVSGKDNATDGAAATSDAYYTIDKDGNYAYNTDLFDPEKFSGVIYVHDIPFQLPLDCETLAASNIYVGSKEWFENELGYEGNVAQKMLEAGDDEKHEGLVYKEADSAAENVKGYGTLILFNPTEEELPINQCQIGRYDFMAKKKERKEVRTALVLIQ